MAFQPEKLHGKFIQVNTYLTENQQIAVVPLENNLIVVGGLACFNNEAEAEAYASWLRKDPAAA